MWIGVMNFGFRFFGYLLIAAVAWASSAENRTVGAIFKGIILVDLVTWVIGILWDPDITLFRKISDLLITFAGILAVGLCWGWDLPQGMEEMSMAFLAGMSTLGIKVPVMILNRYLDEGDEA